MKCVYLRCTALNEGTDWTALTHLLWIRDVAGISQDKGAKLVEVLHCPPPLVGRAEALKHTNVTETLASTNTHTHVTSRYGVDKKTHGHISAQSQPCHANSHCARSSLDAKWQNQMNPTPTCWQTRGEVMTYDRIRDQAINLLRSTKRTFRPTPPTDEPIWQRELLLA